MAQNPPNQSGDAQDGPPPSRGPVDPQGTNQAPTPPAGYMPMMQPAAPAGRGIWGRLGASLLTTVLLLSVGLNIYLGIIVAAYTGGGPREAVYEDGRRHQRIVVLPIEEMVTDSTYDFVRQSLRALTDNKPAAVVLRIDCPGGTVAASDRIWHELTRFKQETGIPIVASFGSVAASGGYYVAAPADAIIAEPTTITGSIGVIVMGFTLQEMLDKIGVTPEIVTSTGSTKKDQLLPIRAWTDEERETLRQTRLEPAYERFVHVVHEGRGHLLNDQEIRNLATGEVFSAQQALDLKLIDDIGYLEDAIALVREQAGIPDTDNPRVTIMRQPRGFGLTSLFAASPADLSVKQLQQLSPEQLRAWVIEMAAPQLMYSGTAR